VSPDGEASMTPRIRIVLILLAALLPGSVLPAATQTTPGQEASARSEDAGQSATDLSRKLANPVSTTWSIANQINNYRLANGSWSYNWNFQPLLPVSLTENWNLITRPVVAVYNSVPIETAPGEVDNTTAFGDTIVMEHLSPAKSGPWLLGIGPTFVFPTAASADTGQGKWQAGPSFVFGYLSKKYIIGVFPQQWWSFGGDSSRPETSLLNLQPIASLFFKDGWSVGYSGNVLANWKGTPGNVWTVPVGIGVNKVVKFGRLPVKVGAAVQYMVVRPEPAGQKWDIQITLVPVIPKLVKGTLF
jgi:hypothetical protein